MVEEYRGPILYVIHSPTFQEHQTPAEKDHNKKVLDAMQKAASMKIPIVINPPAGYTPQLDKQIKLFKKKPKIIFLTNKHSNGYLSHNFRQQLEKEGIYPTTITGMGRYRDQCVIDNLEHARQAFPDAKIWLVEGTHTLAYKLNRAYLRRRMATAKIKKSRKLNPKHFV